VLLLLLLLQLLYGTCLAIFNTTTHSSSTNTTTAKGSSKPAAKQARKTTPLAILSSSSSSSVTLSPRCLQLLAECMGCHLLFRHQQQLQQQLRQHPQHQPGSSSSWCWCEEAARILADPQQSHLHLLLTHAIMSLLHDPCTRAAACNMLCTAAEAICGPTATAAAAGGEAAAAGRQQNKQSAAVSSQASMLLLELLSGLLTSHWPADWVCGRTAGCSTNDSSGGSTAAAAAEAADVSVIASDTLRQLLAASLLPQLQPVAAQCTSAAARKLWLGIAAVAAVPPPWKTATPTAAAAVGAGAAAGKGQVAGLLALAAAAHSDRDATVRSKALGLMQQAMPSFLQSWQLWDRLQSQQQQHQDVQTGSRLLPEGAGTTAAAAAGASETASATAPVVVAEAVAGLRTAAAATAAALMSQLLGGSKASRLKALQLLQQMLQRPTTSSANHSLTAAPVAMAAGGVQQLQQQLACVTFPAICSILAAGQSSRLFCPNCKASAAELLPAMAAVLQPQQALQLALSHSSSSSGGGEGTLRMASVSAQQDLAGNVSDKEQDPAALLLASLAKCSAQQLYELLQQQLTLLGACATGSSAGAANPPDAAAAAGTLGGGAADPAVSSSSSSSSVSWLSRAELISAGRPLVTKLQQMVGGMRGREGLRRHAFIQTCQALTRAADAAAEVAAAGRVAAAAEVAASDAGTLAQADGLPGAAAAAQEMASDAGILTNADGLAGAAAAAAEACRKFGAPTAAAAAAIAAGSMHADVAVLEHQLVLLQGMQLLQVGVTIRPRDC
jgi:hypothetical protein